MSVRMRSALAIAFILALAPSVQADKAKAEQYFRAGAAAFKQQSYAAAAAQFELAYKELELPEIAFSAAQAYRRQYFIEPKPEYVQRAVELYRVYLDKVKTGGRVGDASDGLAEMQRELDRLTAHGERIDAVSHAGTRLAVSVSVAGEAQAVVGELSSIPATDNLGATATVDGEPVSLFSPVDVQPGEHAISVIAPGYFPAEERRRVLEGTTELVEIQLKAQPAHVAFAVPDGAELAIDGRAVGDAPLPEQELAAGRHLVTVTARGREPIVREVVVKRGERKRVELALAKTGKRRAVPYVLGGAGVLAIGSGIATAFALSYDSKLASLEHTRVTVGLDETQLASLRTDARRRDEARTTALALGGGAVATALVAAALFWFDVPRPTERTIVAPTATATGAGVTLVGRF